MKQFNIIAIVILLVAIIFTIFVHTKQTGGKVKIAHNTKLKTLADKEPKRILTPDPKTVLGSSTSANMRTFTSQDGGYAITYPAVWTPGTNEQIQGFSGDVFVFTTGPIGNKVLGYPSFIQIAVDENPQNTPIEEFIKKNYGEIAIQQTTVGSYSAEMVADIPGPAKSTVFIVKPDKKVFQIRFYDGAEPKISKQDLTNVLNSFTIKKEE